ncbi:hypothetical protein F4703DRAFT_1796777 [Phycomyces blakesleeanus]
MFHENNGHGMSAFTGQIQYLFVSDIIDHFVGPIIRKFKVSKKLVNGYKLVEIYEYRVINAVIYHSDIELNEFTFTRSDFQNILPVHRILMPAAIDVHTTATSNTYMLIALLFGKVYA